MIDEENCLDFFFFLFSLFFSPLFFFSFTNMLRSFLIRILFCQVSALKCGFLSVSQESVMIGEVSYHDYYGILVDPEERDTIARNLGPLNKVSHT